MKDLSLTVEEFTTPSPVTATEESRISELAQMMREHGIRHLPIVQNDRVVGIVSDRDLKVLTNLQLDEKEGVVARDIMVRDPVTVTANQLLHEVAFVMSKNKIGSVIVNEENGEFLGIFTVTDALNALIELGPQLSESQEQLSAF